MAYQYRREVVLSQMPDVIRWLQSKADEAGSETTQVSGLDCKVAADMVAGLLAEIDRLRYEAIAAADEIAFLRSANDDLTAENEAMRPLVEAVAIGSVIATGSANTRITGPVLFNTFADMPALHERARAFVAAHPATSTAAGEAESEA